MHRRLLKYMLTVSVGLLCLATASHAQFKEEALTEGGLWFDEYLLECTTLTAEYDGVTIVFVFMNGELYSTAMYKTASWE